MLYAATFAGFGGAISGAISKLDRRVIVLASTGLIVGFVVVAILSNDGSVGGIFGAPIGAILGAMVGVILKKRLGWT